MIHHFDTTDAEIYGLNEAILLSNFKFWITTNRANDKNHFIVDDKIYPELSGQYRFWTYNSVKAYQEIFPYLSPKQIRGAIDRLVDKGILIKGFYSENTFDRTSWYAFYSEEIHLPHRANGNLPSSAHPFAPQGKCYNDTDSKPDTKPHTGERVFFDYYTKNGLARCNGFFELTQTTKLWGFDAEKFESTRINAIIKDKNRIMVQTAMNEFYMVVEDCFVYWLKTNHEEHLLSFERTFEGKFPVIVKEFFKFYNLEKFDSIKNIARAINKTESFIDSKIVVNSTGVTTAITPLTLTEKEKEFLRTI